MSLVRVCYLFNSQAWSMMCTAASPLSKRASFQRREQAQMMIFTESTSSYRYCYHCRWVLKIQASDIICGNTQLDADVIMCVKILLNVLLLIKTEANHWRCLIKCQTSTETELNLVV